MVVPIFANEHKKKARCSPKVSLIKVLEIQQVVQIFDTDVLSMRLSA